ncbi:MAG TPA: alpha/beta hydrolase [Burkholderiales bacterium]|nr:alpha/beta hydrolase [Burkholderiales bacterium]
MPFVESGGAKLFYSIDDHTDAWTKPETVVFVHGFTENTEAWRAWVPHFSRRYRMIRYDQRGFGQSGPFAKDFPLTTEVVVCDLASVIRSLAGGGPAHVVGGKSGGIPVMMLAVRHPELVKTITVACSPVTPPNAAGWIEEMETKGMRAWAYRTQRERFGSKFPEAGINWWADLMGGTAVSTAHAYLRWVGAIDIREDIKRIKCPTLVIGTDTPRRGKAEFEGWQKTIPNSELAIIPVDGYHAAGTAPDETARVTLDFLARHSAKR